MLTPKLDEIAAVKAINAPVTLLLIALRNLKSLCKSVTVTCMTNLFLEYLTRVVHNS